jgi:hypothetical protein
MQKRYVIIRTYSMGASAGYLESESSFGRLTYERN